jgi:hypothetical protein
MNMLYYVGNCGLTDTHFEIIIEVCIIREKLAVEVGS